MEGKIILTGKELQKIKIMELLAHGKMTVNNAAEKLGLSARQVKRLKKRYEQSGETGVVHKNRGKTSEKAFPSELKERIVDLRSGKYSGMNDSHFTEMLREKESINISRESVRKILRAVKIAPKRKRRPTKHRSRRPRKNLPGEMIQWDGSPHRWFGDESQPCCLMAAVDDATSEIVGGFFIRAESSEGYLRLLSEVLSNRGVPLSVYNDRHSSLIRNDSFWSVEEQLAGKQYPTHVGRVLEELGIRQIPAYSPQAKGRVERLFGVLQDRMIAEMRVDGISDMEAGNQWLREIFIPRYNAKFGRKAAFDGSAYRKICRQEISLRVCYAYECVVSNDNCVSVGGVVIGVGGGRKKVGYAGKKVMVRQHLDGVWSVWHKSERIGSHEATEFREPVRSCARRSVRSDRPGGSVIQVYLGSKPPPL